MKRLDLLLKVRDLGGFKCPSLLDSLLEFILEYQGVNKCDVAESDIKQVKNVLKVFLTKAKEKFQKNQRMYERLFVVEEIWLNVVVDTPFAFKLPVSQGRPRKAWEELGDRSKRAKVAELSANHPEALAKAAFKVQIKSENSERMVLAKSSDRNNNAQ